jgi:hypothetical protein
MREMNALAVREAVELGHVELDPQHQVLAMLHPEATPSRAGQALRACGLTHESFRREVEQLPPGYLARGREVPEGGGRTLSLAAMQLDARAEGIALGRGNPRVRIEDVLLAIIWEEPPSMVTQLLDRLGATRERIREELEALKVDMPALPFRPRREWEEWREVSQDELERLSAKRRTEGTLYRIARKGDRTLVSVEKATS